MKNDIKNGCDAVPTGPLQGIRIVDTTSVVFGAYATQILADLGADVIKVEFGQGRGGAGDVMRSAGIPPEGAKGLGPIFVMLNRNKRSVQLDLRKEEDASKFRKIVAESDVFASTVRSAGLARLGFDYDGVKAIRSDIIYAHGVGYGSDGPYAGRPAYDDIVQMASGMADLLSKTDGDPQPRLLPTLIADKVAGLFMAQAIMAGLIHRNATGQGQYIEVPMLEVTASFNLVEHFFGHTFDPPTGPWTYWRVTNPYRRPHPTKDGYIGLLPYDEQQWQKFFALAGVGPEIMQDPRFSTDDARRRNIQDLYAIMGEHTTQFTTQEWLDKLIPLDVPATAVARFEDLPNDPHLKAVGFFRRLRHPVAGDFVTVAPPVRYSATPANIYRLPPQLGEHTDEVLRELDSGDSANESHREGPDRAVTSSPAPL